MTPQLELIPLRAAVCADRATTLDVVVRIVPPQASSRSDRRPSLNLGFVIDRSGSMSSLNKLDYAKKAVCYAIEHLLPSDRLSVTIFDDQIQTIIPSTPVNNKASFIRRVQQIYHGGGTALHGGWVQGGIQVSQALTADLNRIILLSDGLANVGETNPDAIASDVHGLSQRGVSTSTLGLGDDYNEDLLQAMARSGDGNYYYVARAEQLPSIFEQELQGLTTIVGKAVTLGFEPQGVVVVEAVLNDLEVDEGGRFKLPNLLQEQPIDIVVRLKVPALAQLMPLCSFHLTWTDTDQRPQEVRATLQLPVVDLAQWEQLPLNQDVQQQVALMMAARAKKEAVQLVDRGDYAAASQVLQSTKQQMLDFQLPMSAPEAAALADLDARLQKREYLQYRKMATQQVYSRSGRFSRGHNSLLYALEGGPKLGDITQQELDAIVNSADRFLSDSGVISRAIHRAAGPELLVACQELGGCPVGEAKLTPGFQLRSPWVIHTVCPEWQGGDRQETEILAQCYRSCLELAAAKGLQSIAFPALGVGALGFPVAIAARVAIATVGRYLTTHSEIGTVRLVCFNEAVLQTYRTEFQQSGL